ncbi:SMC-Scp complex subunit ScpB [Calycomorphotria hydatis]|uniref:Segregation and condensation protein B n=1 Tax=Calycomorphotria hydatis TaxID=2528027 RepID=A0A517T379_9PLAN|nr:SMC-Scp complex subunit ScpB [Calycomorphotria hydatis]QDT62837.1 hypothetical protein V22_00350 [Calycomorphotria hydatis]
MDEHDGNNPDESPETIGFDDDIESAYRQALEAIEGTDLLTAPAVSEPQEGEANSEESATGAATAVAATPARISAKQVIEAALFVGGTELTLKKLTSLLNDEYSADAIERMIEELNRQYATRGRAYLIDFGEGGYRMALRAQHEPIRHRVFGLGPKEVRLTQDALEVLALVAYRQPITRTVIEEHRDGSAGSILGSLVRRGLVNLQRDDSKTITYTTTNRFLEVFGLKSLKDLPQIERLEFK